MYSNALCINPIHMDDNVIQANGNTIAAKIKLGNKPEYNKVQEEIESQ